MKLFIQLFAIWTLIVGILGCSAKIEIVSHPSKAESDPARDRKIEQIRQEIENKSVKPADIGWNIKGLENRTITAKVAYSCGKNTRYFLVSDGDLKCSVSFDVYDNYECGETYNGEWY